MNTPKIKNVRVIPVAGRDSMLLNLSGAHDPWFTRNLLVLEDNCGNFGIGEVPGSQSIRKGMERAGRIAMEWEIGAYRSFMTRLDTEFIPSSEIRGSETYDLRTGVHVKTAFETAFLDLFGKFLGLPVADLLGRGRVRSEVPVLGYLFFVGDGEKSGLGYRTEDDSKDQWKVRRNLPALGSKDIILQAEAVRAKYGVDHFKLKGGVLEPRVEAQIVADLADAFPGSSVSIDPNGCWSLKEAIEIGKDLGGTLAYAEDPCGAEDGFSGREVMSEFKRATNIRTATNMIATDWRELAHAITLDSVDIPLADPHFWTMDGSVTVGQICHANGLIWGSHSNNHFDVSLAMFAHVAAAVPGEIAAVDTHWIWQDGQCLTLDPPKIESGRIRVGDEAGLGIEPDFDAIESAHQNFRDNRLGDRDDSRAMRTMISDWRFNPKRPCLVRDA